MKNKSAYRGAVMGIVTGGLTAGWFYRIDFVAGLSFGWQLLACATFGAVTGLIQGLAFRFWDHRVRRQNQ